MSVGVQLARSYPFEHLLTPTATHTYNQLPQGTLATNIIEDHGFRVLTNDP
jgi:hypothetical protein